MAPEFSRMVYRVTFALVALAALAVEVAANDGRAVLPSLGLAAGWIVAAVVVAYFLPWPQANQKRPPRWVAFGLAIIAMLPFATEPLRRSWTGDGYPLELQMVCSLRNVGLGLAACGAWLACLRLATVASLFMMLFSVAMTNHGAVLVLLGFYTAVGCIWMMLLYWSGLSSVLVSTNQATTIEIVTERQRLPWLALAVLICCLIAGFSIAIVGPKRATYALGELLPTSGGTGATDPFARYGIGDGPEETAGENAQTAGMVETDRMIEDNKDSLIDAVNDMYGPPHKPPKEQERMVSAGIAEVIENHGKLRDNKKPSREFDTQRRGPKSGRKPESSAAARGFFEVQGRTPLHVRMVAYDRYDVTTHRWLEARQPNNRMIEPTGRDWMQIVNLRESASWYLESEQHQLKTAKMPDNLVPTPAMLTNFRINKVDRADYYEWDYEGVLALAGRKRTPPGVIVHTICRTLDYNDLSMQAFYTRGQSALTSPTLFELPESLKPELERLAYEWTADLPRGWPQIQAILNKLRTEYEHDLSISAPQDHPAPVLWFLRESKRGPDYLFATATALLLRTLDYPTRTCLGFYAAPQAYDSETDHTPVKDTDLHTWAEVRLTDGHWLVLEATPGYDTLPPRLPLWQRLIAAAMDASRWVQTNWIACLICFTTLLVLVSFRRELIDLASVWLWWLTTNDDSWKSLRGALAILERRARWAGLPRAAQQTRAAWLRSFPCLLSPRHQDQQNIKGETNDLHELARLTEWHTYATEVPDHQLHATRLLCRRVLQNYSLKQWLCRKRQSQHNPQAPAQEG